MSLLLLLSPLLAQSLLRRRFFRFRRTIGPPPERMGTVEPVTIAAASGPRLSGWWLPGGAAEQGAVLLVHGIGASRLSMLRRARTLRERGFSVLLFDQRAHGESGGSHTGFGLREAGDVAAALRFVRERLPGARCGVIAISLGGAATLLGEPPPAFDALVLESVFADVRPAIATRIEAFLSARIGDTPAAWATPPLARLFGRLLPFLLGVPVRALRPIDRIGGLAAPVLVLSGAEDPFTTAAETDALFARAPEPKSLLLVPGASHTDLERFAPDAYWDAVMPFLLRHLRMS